MFATTSPLPLTVPLQPREVAFSYLGRLAARNGVSSGDFALDMGLPLAAVDQGRPDALAKLAQLGGVSERALAAWSPARREDRAYRFRDETFIRQAFTRTWLQGCPDCLREDLDRGGPMPVRRMAIRGHWLLKYTTICLEHSRPLVRLWQVRALRERHDTAARFEEIADRIAAGALDLPMRAPTSFELWYQKRLDGARGPGWLDRFALGAAADFCDRFGAFLMEGRCPESEDAADEVLRVTQQAGCDLVSQGREAVIRALEDRRLGRNPASLSVIGNLGPLWIRFGPVQKTKEYWPFQELLRTYVLDTYPIAAGTFLFGERVEARRKHTVLTAAREVGIDPRRMRKHLDEAGLIAAPDRDKKNAHIVLDAREIAPFLKRLAPAVSATALREAFDISRSQFDLLRQDGFFPPLASGKGAKPLWDLAAGRKQVRLFFSMTRKVSPNAPEWIDLAKAAQRLKTRPGLLLRIAEDRRKRGQYLLARVDNEMRYTSLRVRLSDFEARIERDGPPGLTLFDFAVSVGMKPRAVSLLGEAGLIPTTLARNPVTKAVQPYITSADMAAFHAAYVTLTDLADLTGDTWQALRPRLKTLGVSPLSRGGQEFGSVFAWPEIEAIFLCRWPKPSEATSNPLKG